MKQFLKPILIMGVITLLLLYKVYLSNNIYLISRDIQKLENKIEALKEERNLLKLKIEKLKYKNTIVDPLFTYVPQNQKIEELDDNSSNMSPKTKKKKIEKKVKPKVKHKKNAKELFKNIDSKELF